MAIAVAFVPATNQATLQPVTVNLTGLANSTDYGVTITHPSGAGVIHQMSDGSGNLTFGFVPEVKGTYKFDVRPWTEHSAGTVAAGTASFTSTGQY